MFAHFAEDVFERFTAGEDEFVGLFNSPDVFEREDVRVLFEHLLSDNSWKLIKSAIPKRNSALVASPQELHVTDLVDDIFQAMIKPFI